MDEYVSTLYDEGSYRLVGSHGLNDRGNGRANQNHVKRNAIKSYAGVRWM